MQYSVKTMCMIQWGTLIFELGIHFFKSILTLRCWLVALLTECDAKLLIININDIPQLKGCVNLCCLVLVREGHLVIVRLNTLR